MIKTETVTSVEGQDERPLHDDELDAVSGGIQDEENFIQDEEDFVMRDVTMLALASSIARVT
jgi:hypothetical protein